MSLADAPLRALLLADAGWLPERASSVAERVDLVFGFLFWLSAFFLALIVGLTVLFVVRYRRTATRRAPEASPDHSTRLEVFWSAIPLLLVLVIFAVSTQVYLAMTTVPAGADALRIEVTAKRWSWWFDHPGGKGAKELHVVRGRPVELVLGSIDVVHSLYVPAFRLKQDAVPGRYTRMVFTPTREGRFPVVCAEYCGTAHSQMNATVVVHPDQAAFDAWALEGRGQDLSLVDLGRKVFDDKGCSACHTVTKADQDTAGIGPSLWNEWGKTEKLADGTTVTFDENYVRESIVKPGARIAAGYDDVMPPIPLEERELLAVIAYLRSLTEGGGGSHDAGHEDGRKEEHP
jgi:cytochrome c oxidase subunit 2